jgi:hypothetical protein
MRGGVMRRNDKPERRDAGKSDTPQEQSALGKPGRFADYTTPAMNELLTYGQHRLRINGAAVSL